MNNPPDLTHGATAQRSAATNPGRPHRFLLSAALLALVSAALTTGCASIIDGGPGKVSLKSEPSGAAVSIYNLKEDNSVEFSGTTPTVVELKRSDGFFSSAKYKVVFSKSGFKTTEVMLNAHVDGWYLFGNFVFGGAIGWIIVDPATGAMWALPDEVDGTLPAQTAKADGGPTIVLALRQDMTDAQMAHAKLIRAATM